MSAPPQTDASLPRHRWTVTDYHTMSETGLLHPDARVELIDGDVVDRAPVSISESGTLNRLVRHFCRHTGRDAIVSPRGPVVLDPYSEPQPDFALLRWRKDFYSSAHPGPEDVLLLIEVSDTALGYGRGIKVPLYARHGIPEVWLVDLQGRRIERYLEPEATGRYRRVDHVSSGMLSPALFPAATLALSEVFPAE